MGAAILALERAIDWWIEESHWPYGDSMSLTVLSSTVRACHGTAHVH